MRFVVIVVAEFRPNRDSLAQPEGQAGRDDGVQSLEARALALKIIEEFKPGRSAQAGRELVRKVIEHAQPVGRANGGHVGHEAVQRLEGVVEPWVELVRVHEVKYFRIW